MAPYPDTIVTLIAKYKIRDATKVEDVRTLVAQFIAKVKENESETCLQYTWSIINGGNQQLLCCQETYMNVAGVTRHLENVGALFAPFVALVELESSEVHAPPSAMEEIRASPIGRWNPTYFEIL